MSTNLFKPQGHFYSPLTNSEEVLPAIDKSESWGLRQIPGVDLCDELMKKTWQDFLPAMKAIPFSENKSNSFRYYYENGYFSYGDACFYYGAIATLKPKKIIEIGSGYSSALALDARDLLNLDIKLTFIEPFPETFNKLLSDADHAQVTLIEDKVQNVKVEIFEELERDDILFIDSSHVMKTGSDVCFEIFDILPRLKPGVIVHFHDIFYPFEYPRSWALDEQRSWNEAYALRAFLMYNSKFEVFFFNHYFFLKFPDLANDPSVTFGKNFGGGLWLRVK